MKQWKWHYLLAGSVHHKLKPTSQTSKYAKKRSNKDFFSFPFLKQISNTIPYFRLVYWKKYQSFFFSDESSKLLSQQISTYRNVGKNNISMKRTLSWPLKNGHFGFICWNFYIYLILLRFDACDFPRFIKAIGLPQ